MLQNPLKRLVRTLAPKVAGKLVKVFSYKKDRYDRSIGTVHINDLDVTRWMVEYGWAWQYLQYDKYKILKDCQDSAKFKKLGIWSQGVAIPPWEYRANKKKKAGDNAGLSYWLNTGSNSCHNSTCKWYNNTKQGRACKLNEGRACGQCGG